MMLACAAAGALHAAWAGPGEEDAQALTAALVPGTIIQKDGGWVISHPQRGNVYVMREPDGYTISGNGIHYRLIAQRDGYTLSAQDPNRRPVPLEEVVFSPEFQRAKNSRVVSRVHRR